MQILHYLRIDFPLMVHEGVETTSVFSTRKRRILAKKIKYNEKYFQTSCTGWQIRFKYRK